MMPPSKNLNDLKSFIREGKTGRVFDYLNQNPEAAVDSNALSVLEGEYNRLIQSEIKGTLSAEELLLRKNQINDKLLAVIDGKSVDGTTKSTGGWLKMAIPFGIVLAGLAALLFLTPSNYACPDFSQEVRNKILILPFENVGADLAKPQVVLRDRINQLSLKNNLSSDAQLGDEFENLTLKNVPGLAKNCDADLVVWGTYSSKVDSIRLNLQYFFTEHTPRNESGKMVTLKDVTALQNGKMLKDLDDAVLSLCGVLALRDGNDAIAKKWFNKVKHPEEMDEVFLELLTSNEKSPLKVKANF